MGFVKGIVTGMMVGVAIGAMNNDNVMNAVRRSKKGMRRFTRKMMR